MYESLKMSNSARLHLIDNVDFVWAKPDLHAEHILHTQTSSTTVNTQPDFLPIYSK